MWKGYSFAAQLEFDLVIGLRIGPALVPFLPSCFPLPSMSEFSRPIERYTATAFASSGRSPRMPESSALFRGRVHWTREHISLQLAGPTSEF